MAPSRLVELIDSYKSAHGVPDAELARRIGISRQNLSLWRTTGFRALPARNTLDGVAAVVGRPYREVLEAAPEQTVCGAGVNECWTIAKCR